ncbi:DUF397 domain-containing protein [Streptomyces sp. NBC_00236]|uniref:DUF397 domain-containing protein n=1 Tax=Streptomyces sp. NBC_00236 TaxID=2903639 RepID=UPI002E2E0E74|nr:DUF397 domain-containing protein [Streptomyces sp. NBC_00236]
MSTTELNWFKSSYSGGDGDNCVEVALAARTVHVRDSKDTDRRPFAVSTAAWSDFTAYASTAAS